MGTETADDHREETNTLPKLTLIISRPSKPTAPPDMPTPPPQTAVSVPFQWEEAPGKPRPCHTQSKPKSVARTLELPPRLLFSEAKVSNAPSSPTTVLEGPYVGRAVSFTTSYRNPLGLSKEHWNGNFGSSRWSGARKSREEFEGSFDFSGSAGRRSNEGTAKAKITRVRRGGSFFSLSQTRSHLWGSIYESLKQVVPWRRKQDRQTKWCSKTDTRQSYYP